jgi:hypothetical protein
MTAIPSVPRRMIVCAGAVGLSLLASCQGVLPSPVGNASTSQAVVDLGNLVVQIREENAQLQAQIDSLRSAAAYTDTVVRQLAGAAGLSMRPPAAVVP